MKVHSRYSGLVKSFPFESYDGKAIERIKRINRENKMTKTENIEITLTRGKTLGLMKVVLRDYPKRKALRLVGAYAPPLHSRDNYMMIARVMINLGTEREYATYGYEYGKGWTKI